ncbi:S-layer homology domain-containing protein [Paenibacillus sp. NPDC056579]|uniref:S-layer homology domain-containing protein n=1 Tax=Paenibacillus sp. NPDC056579 TaxID=3345871 RepID=UPI003699869C
MQKPITFEKEVLPVNRQVATFADDAIEAVKAIQETGVVNGRNNNLYDPAGNATRTEASTILRWFVEFVIDEGTALLSENDSGQ